MSKDRLREFFKFSTIQDQITSATNEGEVDPQRLRNLYDKRDQAYLRLPESEKSLADALITPASDKYPLRDNHH